MDTSTYLYIILAAIVSLAIAAFHYFYKVKKRSKTDILLTFLRFLSVFSLLLLLINPQIESQQLETIKPKLVVATDNSSSIKHLNQTNEVRDLVTSIKENSDLQDKFDVAYFSFTDTLNDGDSLNFKTNKTNISNSLTAINTLFKENNTIVLVTDGNQTIGADYSYFKSKNTIYPIAVGDTTVHEDLKISKLNANKYSFLNNTFPVEVFVSYNGEHSASTNLTVYKGNSPVFKKTINLSKDNNSERVEFNLSANAIGVHNYSAVVSKIDSEKNTINNRKNFSVEVINEQAKVAIISDMLHPDLGMLKRSIETNKQRKVEIIQLENNIEFKDYQLVIIYQPNNKFKAVFDKLEEAKSNYLIISGTKTDWYFLNKIQKDFSKATINQAEEYFPTKNSSYSAFLVENFNFDNLPPLKAKFGEVTFNIPSETLLYQSINGIQTEKPLLATFSKENRRGALLAGEGIWQWRVYSFTQNKSFYEFDNFINKLTQYLAAKKKLSRLDLAYEPIVYQSDAVVIDATYFDSNYEIDTRANLMLTLKDNTTNETKNYPFRVENNQYTTAVSGLKKGDYNFTVSVEGQRINRSGAFTVLDYNIEQQFTHANTESLKSLAKNSKGEFYHISNYNSLVNNLINNETIKPIQKSTTKQLSLIDWKWLLAIIAIALSAEWFIRKYFGKI